MKQVANGEIFVYPKFDVMQIQAKAPSQELNGILVKALQNRLETVGPMMTPVKPILSTILLTPTAIYGLE